MMRMEIHMYYKNMTNPFKFICIEAWTKWVPFCKQIVPFFLLNEKFEDLIEISLKFVFKG